MVVRVNGSTGIITVSGTSGAPSLRGPDGNSGISFDGDQVIISSSGLVAATFSDSAATINNLSVDTTTFEFSPGSSGTPTIAASGDLNTGIYFPAADTIGFAEGGNEAARIDDSGRVLIGTNTARRRFFNADGEIPTLQIEGTGVGTRGLHHLSLTSNNTSTSEGAGAFAVFGRSRGGVGDYTVLNSADAIGSLSFQGADGTDFVEAARITALVDGTPGADDMPGRLVFYTTADNASSPTEQLRIGRTGILTSIATYNNTVVNAANAHFGADGVFYRSTSSRKYKADIETLGDEYADAILNIRPVWYRSTTGNDNPDWGWWGFIAEEVAEVDPRLVYWKTVETTHDEKGAVVQVPCEPEPEGVHYDHFVPHLLNLIKRQKAAIETLETANASLEARLTALEARLTALESA